jgi:hypothetical protein
MNEDGIQNPPRPGAYKWLKNVSDVCVGTPPKGRASFKWSSYSCEKVIPTIKKYFKNIDNVTLFFAIRASKIGMDESSVVTV